MVSKTTFTDSGDTSYVSVGYILREVTQDVEVSVIYSCMSECGDDRVRYFEIIR